MRRTSNNHRLVCWLAVAVLGGVVGVALVGSDARGERDRGAYAARVLSVADTAHLHYAGESGLMLVDEGRATGALPGSVRVLFSVGATVKASFTIYTRYGSIAGSGSGELHESHTSNHANVDVSFGGTMRVSRGTGRYAHVHGKGGFYGVINRHDYAAIIQTTGTLSY